MHELQIKGNWNIIKGKLKQAYGELTDDDRAYSEGNEDQLVGRLQQKLGKTREEIQRKIDGSLTCCGRGWIVPHAPGICLSDNPTCHRPPDL